MTRFVRRWYPELSVWGCAFTTFATIYLGRRVL